MRAAVVQLTAGEDKDRNRREAERLVRGAVAAGAQLVVLPEKWNRLGPPDMLAAGAEPLDGPSVTWARAIAQELGIDLVAGSITEAREGHDKHANTSVHVGPDGDLAGVYRKLHLFDVEVGGRTYRESDAEEPGDEIVVSELSDGTGLGMSVCYDLRFPELFRALAIGGARVLSVPSAFTLTTTRDHWEVLVRARAIEDACFVVAANQIGTHPGGFSTGGRSMIVDPWGVVLAQAPDTPGFALAELDLDRVDAVRAQIPALTQRRPEVYA